MLLGAVSGWAAADGPAGDSVAFREALQTFLERRCNDCHAGGADEGGLDLDALSGDLADEAVFARWERIYDRVESGEMPPAKEPRPAAAEVREFLDVLAPPLVSAHSRHKETVLRRLNRREYANTMNDLFGTQVDLEKLFPEDARSHEFDTVGEALGVSLVHLERYLEGSGQVIDAMVEAAQRSKEQPERRTLGYAESSDGKKFIGTVWKKNADGAVVFFTAGGFPDGKVGGSEVRKAGRYRVSVKGYAYQSASPVTFELSSTSFVRDAGEQTLGYFAFEPGEPQTASTEVWMPQRSLLKITTWGLEASIAYLKKQGVDAFGGPGLAIKEVTLEGPLPNQAAAEVFSRYFEGFTVAAGKSGSTGKGRENSRSPGASIELAAANPVKAAEGSLHRLATAAFRRPVTPEQVRPYVELFKGDLADRGSNFASMKMAIAAIFTSPEFLYLQEGERWLDDYALAARLSYFLIRSTPDEDLLAAAAGGRLSKDPQVLLAQTQRLLADPKRSRFVADFTDAWLNLREIEFTNPDEILFPEFDPFLQYSMVEETRRYFDLLIDTNAPVEDFVASDSSVLNNRLASHYGISGVEGPEFRRVKLPPRSVRGGFLSQASVLKVTANGTVTSPVTRGVWVTERLLGRHVPPPPAGVPGVEPDIRGATTLRELLDKHRSLDSCRGCHRQIDPPGFALESFDPIGGWQDRFRSLGEGEKVPLTIKGKPVRYRLGPKVDASGETADRVKFSGFVAFRSHLAKQEDELARAFITKLLTFASGREMGFSDRKMIESLVQKSKAKGHGVHDMIEIVVLSPAFRSH
jgi:hypothetical protein